MKMQCIGSGWYYHYHYQNLCPVYGIESLLYHGGSLVLYGAVKNCEPEADIDMGVKD